jgi:hypothetical protein
VFRISSAGGTGVGHLEKCPSARLSTGAISLCIAGEIRGPMSRGAHSFPNHGVDHSTKTTTTPDRIIPSARAAVSDTSITRPLTKGPRSLMRQWIE